MHGTHRADPARRGSRLCAGASSTACHPTATARLEWICQCFGCKLPTAVDVVGLMREFFSDPLSIAPPRPAVLFRVYLAPRSKFTHKSNNIHEDPARRPKRLFSAYKLSKVHNSMPWPLAARPKTPPLDMPPLQTGRDARFTQAPRPLVTYTCA